MRHQSREVVSRLEQQIGDVVFQLYCGGFCSLNTYPAPSGLVSDDYKGPLCHFSAEEHTTAIKYLNDLSTFCLNAVRFVRESQLFTEAVKEAEQETAPQRNQVQIRSALEELQVHRAANPSIERGANLAVEILQQGQMSLKR